METFQLDSTGVQYRTPVLLCWDVYASQENKENGFGFFSYIVQQTCHLAVSKSQKLVFDNPWVSSEIIQQRLVSYIYIRKKSLFSIYTDNKWIKCLQRKCCTKCDPYPNNDFPLFLLNRCNGESEEDRRVISLQLDREHHALFVAFSSCVIRIPLSRCERHGSCKKYGPIPEHPPPPALKGRATVSLGKEVENAWLFGFSLLQGHVLLPGTHTAAG